MVCQEIPPCLLARGHSSSSHGLLCGSWPFPELVMRHRRKERGEKKERETEKRRKREKGRKREKDRETETIEKEHPREMS